MLLMARAPSVLPTLALQAQGKLAAAEQLLTMGQSALSGKLGAQEVLHAEALSLEEAVGQLAGERLPELNDAAARLNDTRILAVRAHGHTLLFACSIACFLARTVWLVLPEQRRHTCAGPGAHTAGCIMLVPLVPSC